jgi:hypothetical protein
MSSLDHEARAANQFWFRKARHFILGNCDGSEYFPLLRSSARELEICNVSISSLRLSRAGFVSDSCRLVSKMNDNNKRAAATHRSFFYIFLLVVFFTLNAFINAPSTNKGNQRYFFIELNRCT